ncbi:DUF6468 domain-containing protein [Roseibacterium beibuensis]|uniref:DUF6468 domain-containing protein n=1 Tax=[Roseibacterium] beibuensis TaxID=1193142 RepID=UPI00217E4644|nr:DUF6468 domain-containing protein [Roseibacterium beibuensis]MCS6626554.1 DUF6468 domain-containing protein [Roseibacterium beibuensis]
MMLLVTYAADILLFFSSFGAAFYCMILSRRLSRLTSFDQGIGGAIAVLSTQVDEMKSALTEAKAGSDGAGRQLNDLVRQAREISGELELMIAACHDFAEQAIEVQGASGAQARPDAAAGQIQAAGPAPERAADHGRGTESGTEVAMPVFGTRRAAPDLSDIASQAATPLFRHRGQAAEG